MGVLRRFHLFEIRPAGAVSSRGLSDCLARLWIDGEACEIWGEMRKGWEERGRVGVQLEGAFCAQVEVQIAEGPGAAGDWSSL